MIDYHRAVGLRILELLRARHMSERKLSAKTGMPVRDLKDAETGSFPLTHAELTRIMDALGVSREEFFNSPLFEDPGSPAAETTVPSPTETSQ